MQHGESGAALPRQLSNVVGRKICDAHNSNGKRWHGTPDTMFQVAEADMSKVVVEDARRRRIAPK